VIRLAAVALSFAVALLPAAPARAGDDPWAGRTDLLQPPPFKPSTKVDLGKVVRFTLPNGLRVIVVPRPTSPTISVMLALRAGDVDAPLAQAGLATFTADMLRKGTQTRSADQIADAIDFVGGSLGAQADEDSTTVSCGARARDLELCLDLVADVTQRPTFPEAEMGEVLDQLKASVENIKDSPGALAAQHAANLYFGDDDARGRAMSLTTLSTIDRGSLVEFHRRAYAPNRAILAVAGAVDPALLRKSLTKHFGGWPKGEAPADEVKPLPSGDKIRVRLVDKPDATQSALVLVGPGIAHGAPDYPAVRLMNWALGGGGFSSRLMKVVRAEGGKTYGARSAFDAGRHPGTFKVSTQTRTGETASTLKLLLDELARMRKDGPDATELTAAQGNLIGGFGPALETAQAVAHALLGADFDGLEPRFVERYPAKLAAVKLAQTRLAAQKHLQPAALVIVGRAKEVQALLEKAAIPELGPIEVVPYDGPINGDERQAPAGKTARQAPTPEEKSAGKLLLEQAWQAKGGQALERLKDLTLTGAGTMKAMGQTLSIRVAEYHLPGKAAREDLTLGPGQTVTQIFSDGKAWVKQSGVVMDMPGPQATALRRALWRDPNFLLQNARRGASVRALPALDQEGRTLVPVEVTTPDGESLDLYFDAKSHLLVRLDFVDQGKAKRMELDDYRTTGGIAFPRKVRQSGGLEEVALTYDEPLLNKDLPAALFAR
jgi:zinc protease